MEFQEGNQLVSSLHVDSSKYQSLQLKPNYSKALLNRGLAFYQMDKNVQACSEFQKACDLGECDGLKWALKNEMCTSTPLTAEREDS